MIEQKVEIRYCGTNPLRQESDIFDRLAQDERISVTATMCYKLCTTVCSEGLYAFVNGRRIEGRTETEFLDNVVQATGLDMSRHYQR